MVRNGKKCDFLEREGLARREAGRSIDDHLAGCPTCREALEAYEALEAELARAGDDLAPPPGWRARVRSRVAARREPRRRLWSWPTLPGWQPAVAAAAVVVVVVAAAFLFVDRPGDTGEMALAVWIEAGDEVRRGDGEGVGGAAILEARPGDRLAVEARGAARHTSLRLYRDGRLRSAATLPAGERYQGRWTLDAPGSYQLLLLSSEASLPAPGAGLDRDAAAALDAGATVEWGPAVEVR